MKLEGIKIGEEVFEPSGFSGEKFLDAINKRLLKGVTDCKISEGLGVITQYKEGENLTIEQQIQVARAVVALESQAIINGEIDAKKLAQFNEDDILAVVQFSISQEEFQERIQETLEGAATLDEDEQEEIQVYLELLKNDFDYSKITHFELNQIYQILLEAEFEEILIDFLKEKGINCIYSEPSEGNILFLLQIDNDYFFVPGLGKLLKLKKLRSPGTEGTNSKIYSGISFGNKNAILSIDNNHASWFFYISQTPVVTNFGEYYIVQDSKGFFHIYNPKNEVFHYIGAHFYGVVGGNEDILRLSLDKVGGLYMDFNGKDFGEMQEVEIDSFRNFKSTEDEIDTSVYQRAKLN